MAKSGPKTKDDLARFLEESSEGEITDVEAAARAQTGVSRRLSQGTLAQRSLGDLLAEIYRWRSNGGLLVKKEKVKKIVYFREGRPIYVKSNLLAECLGRVLIREKLISDPDCEESLRRLKSSGRQQGTILIEMGSISPHNLVYALGLQLKTKLFDVFGWNDGSFRFDPDLPAPQQPVELDLTTAAIIYEGIKRAYSEDRVSRTLGDPHHAYPAPAADPLYRLQEIGLDEEEAELLASVDGVKTVAELAIGASMQAPNALRFILAMRTAQILEFRSEPRREPLSASARAVLHAPSPAPPPVPSHGPPTLSRTHQAPARGATEHLLTKVRELKSQSHFEVLGATDKTPAADLHAAYLTLAKAYHPDKHYSSASAEVRELAAEVYQRISAAYEVLTDPEERERYVSELRGGRGSDIPKQISSILAAEGKFERGQKLLQKKQFNEASEAFREAVALYPQEGEFHAYLGWSLFRADPKKESSVEEALEQIGEAIQLNPRVDKAYLFLGYIYKATGRSDRAEAQFEKALQCNPDCAEALHELKLGHSDR